ncbi:MAG: transglutaminase-like cysteine peptidase [Pseudolabrys sp.]|jgi:predicted transglutaminase-like cysteine proteinase
MFIQSQWRAWAFLAAILGVILYCASHNTARAEPSLARVALAPPGVPLFAVPPPSTTAPFNLTQTALAAAPARAMTTKWQSLQSVIAIETQAMAACRTQPHACTASTAHFLAIVDTARAARGRARVGLVNRAINLAIRPARDAQLFGVPDVWQSPLLTFTNGAGDCEDYAIAKYVALHEAGVHAADLRLVIVHDARSGEDHAVTAARIDGEWLILDSRKMLLLADTQVPDLKPLIAFGDEAPRPTFTRDAGLDMRLMPAPAAGFAFG